MKFQCLVFALGVPFLAACNAQQEQGFPTGSSAVPSQAVFYLKTNIPNKIPHDSIVLLTGETVALESEVLQPEPTFERPILFDYKRALSQKERLQTFQVVLDRQKGVICLESKCAQVLTVCPPYNQLERGAKCQVFARKEK